MKKKKTLPQLINELREALERKEKLLDPTPYQLKEEPDLLEERSHWDEQDWADHFADVDFQREYERDLWEK